MKNKKNKKNKKINRQKDEQIKSKSTVIEFELGEPESVLTRPLLDYDCIELDYTGQYYEFPVDINGLFSIRHANPYHGSSITFKRNILSRYFAYNEVITLADFRAAAFDFQNCGNAYFKIINSMASKILKLEHLPAIKIRKMPNGNYCYLKTYEEIIQLKENEVLHAYEYDPVQQVYGIPEWICGIQSVLLSEESTLFRRKYFKNGCHIGYILFTNDENIDAETEKRIRKSIASGKGAGNFKSMFINIPGAKETAIKLIPIGDISQKDEFVSIKNITADEIMVAHRMQPALSGLKPDNTGGFGDINKIKETYIDIEVKQMAHPFEHLNNFLPSSAHFKFDFPELSV